MHIAAIKFGVPCHSNPSIRFGSNDMPQLYYTVTWEVIKPNPRKLEETEDLESTTITNKIKSNI